MEWFAPTTTSRWWWPTSLGLIAGASDGRGLGHRFLRHTERARVLVVLVDLASMEETSPAEQQRVLLEELGAYRPELLERPRILAASKADVAQLDPPPGALRISAVTGEGLSELIRAMADAVGEARAQDSLAPICGALRGRGCPPADPRRIHRGAGR